MTGVAVPVQLVDMCQLDLAGNWTSSDPEHTSTVLSKEAKVLGMETRQISVNKIIIIIIIIIIIKRQFIRRSNMD